MIVWFVVLAWVGIPAYLWGSVAGGVALAVGLVILVVACITVDSR